MPIVKRVLSPNKNKSDIENTIKELNTEIDHYSVLKEHRLYTSERS